MIFLYPKLPEAGKLDLRMNYIRGSDRGEVLVLLEALEDYIAAANSVRFIDAFVGQLDLAKEGFRHKQVPETGRSPTTGRMTVAVAP